MKEGEIVLYQKIKEIAKEKGIAISEIERKCKFSQGSICRTMSGMQGTLIQSLNKWVYSIKRIEHLLLSLFTK